jgi:hypothetical protein
MNPSAPGTPVVLHYPAMVTPRRADNYIPKHDLGCYTGRSVSWHAACDPNNEKVLDVRESSMHLLSEDGCAFEACPSLHPDNDLVLANAAAQIEGALVLDFFLWVFFIQD